MLRHMLATLPLTRRRAPAIAHGWRHLRGQR